MHDTAVQPDDLFRLRLVGDAQVSPDGRRIAYVVKWLDRAADEYRSCIYLWEAGSAEADGTPGVSAASRQFTAGESDSTPRWSPDGRRLAFLSRRGEKQQVYLMTAGGGEAVPLTDLPLGAGTPVWSPDGRWIAFAAAVSTREEPADTSQAAPAHVIERAVYKTDGRGLIDDRRTHIFVIAVPPERGQRAPSPQPATAVQITSGDFNDHAPTWSPDSMHLAFHSNRDPEWDLQARSDIWIVPRDADPAHTCPRRVTDGHGLWISPVFSPDGSRIAFIGFARQEGALSTYFTQLWTVSRSGGEQRNLLNGIDIAVGDSLSGDWSTAGDEALVWREEGIYFLASERGSSTVYRWQEGLQAITPPPRLPDHAGRHVMDFSVGGGMVAYTVADTTHPAEVAIRPADAASPEERVTPVSGHNDAYLSEKRLVRPERISFRGADGASIDGWVMKPVDCVEGQRYPVIVYIHGGPVAAYGETFFHEFQVLAGAGFGVFYCNPHGGSSYGQAFQVSINGGWGTLDYQDMMAAVDRVTALSWVDDRRLGVAGGSYGGFLTNWLISHTDRFAAACTERSICNHVSQGGTSDWAATRGERLGATPESDPELLWAMSPLKYVNQVVTPTLIIHSERDDRCPIEQSEQWFAALKRRRVPVRFVRFPEESHGLSRTGTPSRRLERLDHIVRWFREHL
ncbi:MAG TPA: S9 family peptidase [Chloroflexota bacterium]|nr:S9 family peptidase [Chloroflexota bacterium]